MCSTPYCWGDCDECIADKQRADREEWENASCPHNPRCNIVTIDVKTDKCTTCGEIIRY